MLVYPAVKRVGVLALKQVGRIIIEAARARGQRICVEHLYRNRIAAIQWDEVVGEDGANKPAGICWIRLRGQWVVDIRHTRSCLDLAEVPSTLF